MAYKKTEQGDETVFDTVPEEAPQPPALMSVGGGCLKIIGFCLIWFIVGGVLYSVFPLAIASIGMVVVGGLATLSWRKRRKRGQTEDFMSLAKKNRIHSQFTVSPKGISVNGQFYKTEDIHRVTKRNTVTEATDGQAIFSGTHAYNAGVQMRLAYEKQLAAVSYAVQFESGGVPHLLSGGQTEAGAFAIMSDVSRILGLR
jgi:hypothetical protein